MGVGGEQGREKGREKGRKKRRIEPERVRMYQKVGERGEMKGMKIRQEGERGQS